MAHKTRITLTECNFAYKENAKVKEYVDKYCKKHGTIPEVALKHIIVQSYIEDEVKKNV